MERPLILNRYRPLEVQGKGGFSTVEVAFDTRIQRRVAIKRIPFTDVNPVTAPGLAEARTAAMLGHANIVSVLDFECDADEAFLIMEYVDGLTLTGVMEHEKGQVDLDVAAHVLDSVTSALDFAHENQVLHLDIKPDNILIDYNGRVKVIDFGMSQMASIAGFAEAEGGTLGFMPPEQIMGEQMDQRTDEWALASTVYMMLTGKNPFIAGTMARSLELIDRGDIDPPSSYRNDLSEEIDAIILDALSPDPDVRFDTVAQFADALLPYLGDEKEGARYLAALINPGEDENGEAVVYRGTGLWDRIGTKGHDVIARIACALSGGALSVATGYGAGMELTVVWPAAGAVALASILFPRLGSILALLWASVCLFVMQLPIAGIILAVISIAWWLLLGRRNEVDAALPLVAFPLALAHMTPLFPLLVGFCLPWKRALPTSLLGCLLVLLVAACTGSGDILHTNFTFTTLPSDYSALIALLTNPSTWVIIVGWVGTSVLMAACCSRANRALSIIGSMLGCALMAAFLMVSLRVAAGGTWSAPAWIDSITLGFSFMVMCAITALGAPLRPEEEEEE